VKLARRMTAMNKTPANIRQRSSPRRSPWITTSPPGGHHQEILERGGGSAMA